MRPLVLMLVLLAGLPARGQESVQQALDACIQGEQSESRLLGSVLGALGSLSIGRSRDGGESKPVPALRVGLGTAAGGALGQASAYFNAVGNCFKKNPSWVPASRLERGESYRTAMMESGYAPQDGLVALATGLQMPDGARPESRVELRSRFMLLTPDGAEAQVRIARLLFAIADGQEAALPLPAQAVEQRTLPAGEHWDLVSLPIPKEAPLGVSYRYEFSISVADRPPSSVRGTVKVF